MHVKPIVKRNQRTLNTHTQIHTLTHTHTHNTHTHTHTHTQLDYYLTLHNYSA